MIPTEDMMKLAYQCNKLQFNGETALVFSDKDYQEFVNHYGLFLRLLFICQTDTEFTDTLQRMVIVHEMKKA